MNKLIYEVEFLSDIVLPATSNTEGNITQLDFIPGSNFLGMVASQYNNFEDSFKIFHSGNVRFGDATILKDGKQTYKIPLSLFYDKSIPIKLYNHHLIKDFSAFTQLKQKRDGYITQNFEEIDIEYNYSQKSAYDKENRKSLDSNMYGYSAIRSGTKWQFCITCKDISQKDLELLKSTIIGKKRLGKSKSAQYGLVNISQKGKSENIENSSSKEILLYANSRLALVDEDGNPTLNLTYLFDGLKEDNIDYSKCQIKTSTFTPYNGARQTKDYERICINKGSVMVLQDIKQDTIQTVVGAYQTEGFGEIIINPSFLLKDGSFELKVDDEKTVDNNMTIKSTLAKYLHNKDSKKQKDLNILNEVDTFIQSHTSLSQKKMNSQWGQIRSICSNSTDENIEENIKKYITHGVAKTKWEGKNETIILNGIRNSSSKLKFTKLLSILIPKQKGEKND